MIVLPLFKRLVVDDYELFPGASETEGIDFKIRSGATLIAGINGLGKTTLLNIFFRLLTGPSDISGVGLPPQIGSTLPESPVLNAQIRSPTRREKIYRPFTPGSINVAGAPGNGSLSLRFFPDAFVMTATKARTKAAWSYSLTFASIRSARKGLTSIDVEVTPKNCAARALVPEPPKGSARCLTGRTLSRTARSISSGANASLNRRQP